MAVSDDGDHDGEELPGGGDRGAHERVKVADGVVDEVLAEGGREREAQHEGLTERDDSKWRTKRGGGVRGAR